MITQSVLSSLTDTQTTAIVFDLIKKYPYDFCHNV